MGPKACTHPLFDNAQDLVTGRDGVLLVAHHGDYVLLGGPLVRELHLDAVVLADLAHHGAPPTDDLGVVLVVHFHLQVEAAQLLQGGHEESPLARPRGNVGEKTGV